MHYFITGGAGFIGSTLVDRLLGQSHTVTVYDNFSTGFHAFLDHAKLHPGFRLVVGDLLDRKALEAAMAGAEMVYHFSANADVRFGTERPDKDLQQNTVATFTVLEAMRATGIQRIAFSSTGSIYGEPSIFPTPEDAPFPVQTSLYGASKLACEGLIAAYCEGFGFQGVAFRFVSVLGERYTHGHIFDFCKRLLDNPATLHILGNGKQKKSYIYVQDCLDAMQFIETKAQPGFEVYNLGVDDYIEVNDSVRWITETMGLEPTLSYAGGERGWIGDSPFIYLDTTKIRSQGWSPKLTIRQGVERTIRWLLDNRWALEKR